MPVCRPKIPFTYFVVYSRSSGTVERRISLWMSQSQENVSDTIVSHRMSLHLGRQQAHPEPIAEVQEPPEGEPSKEKLDIVDKIKAAVADEEPPKFDSAFHREMYFIIESHPVQAFIFIVIILNAFALCVMTSETVQIRAGYNNTFVHYLATSKRKLDFAP